MPTYIINGEPVLSAGTIFCRVSYNPDKSTPVLEVLLQCREDGHSWWEDLGGKGEQSDTTISDIAAREGREESLGLISEVSIHSSITGVEPYIKNKYAVWIVFAPPEVAVIEDFGDYETLADGVCVARYMGWTPVDCVFHNPKKVHPRIRFTTRIIRRLQERVTQMHSQQRRRRLAQ